MFKKYFSKNKRNTRFNSNNFALYFKGFFNSFKFRILIYLVSFAVIPVIILSILENYYFTSIISDTEIAGMQTQVAVITDEMKNYETLKQAKESGQFNIFTQFAQISEMRIRIINDNLSIVFDTYEFDTEKTIINESALLAFKKGENISRYVMNHTIIESALPIENKDGEKIGILLLSKNVSKLNASINYVHEYTNLIMIAVISSMVVVAILIVIKMNRKNKQLENKLALIASGQMGQRINTKGYTEFSKNAKYFNEILDNMTEIDKSRDEFVSNVSHELKTPMTSIKLLADSLLLDENTPIEMYKEFMVDITNEIERENALIEDLLSLVRMDNSVSVLNLSLVNINELVEQAMKKLNPIAERKNIEFIFESIRDVVAQVDSIKINQVVNNLIENAIKYNNKDGYVHVSLNADYEYFYLRVEDNGIGIKEEEQKNIFQRFYRVDKARSRDTGGTGLGLSIVKSIVLLHNGQIKVYSEEENGIEDKGLTVFTVKIPLKNNNYKAVQIED